MNTLLIAGATGLVGRHALVAALSDGSSTKVVAPTRRPLLESGLFDTDAGLLEESLLSGRLTNPIIDFTQPPASMFAGVSRVICAIGTTMRKAGSRDTFKAIDHGLVLTLATAAHHAGVPTFAYVSSVGAGLNAASYYLKVKGQVEADLGAIGFKSLTILRPSILGGDRGESRPLERIGLGAAASLKWLIPRRYRVIDAGVVADGLLSATQKPSDGTRIIESEQIARA